MTPFSYANRPDLLGHLASDKFDLLVIGGGITGAGIALDAASRGLKVALVEKNDFAYGTSSRSTKLIHGGLRYLKQLEFGLVKEVGSERAVVHNLAPHLVVPEEMLLPLFEKRGLGYWLTSIGLKVYDWLAGVKPQDQRRMLTRPQTLKREPLLKREGVKGGALYAEYRTDDARLTTEIVKTAVGFGAVIVNYCEVKEFLYANDVVIGANLNDNLTGQQLVVHATTVVSAAGPWVDELREINNSRTGKRLHLTKGVHIVLPRTRLPMKQAIYFDVEDGRMIFAIPRGRITYVGTTDTNYDGDKDNVTTTLDDATYLIGACNAMFPSVHLTTADIESSWAGLRPLIHEEGKSASAISRRDEIFESPSGLISIAGGKLTGYRKMAERVVNLVVKKYFDKRPLKPCHTQKIKLLPRSFANVKRAAEFSHAVAKTLKPFAMGDYMAAYLVENYGTGAEAIMKSFEANLSQNGPELALLKAEWDHCFAHEMVCTLLDFFVRRTGLVNFDSNKVSRNAELMARYAQQSFGWTDARMADALHDLRTFIQSVRTFK